MKIINIFIRKEDDPASWKLWCKIMLGMEKHITMFIVKWKYVSYWTFLPACIIYVVYYKKCTIHIMPVD